MVLQLVVVCLVLVKLASSCAVDPHVAAASSGRVSSEVRI